MKKQVLLLFFYNTCEVKITQNVFIYVMKYVVIFIDFEAQNCLSSLYHADQNNNNNKTKTSTSSKSAVIIKFEGRHLEKQIS